MVDINAKFRLRRANAAAWASANPVLSAGEPGYELDTKVLRIGDGTTAFTSLPSFVRKSEVDAAVALALTYRNEAEAFSVAAAAALAAIPVGSAVPVGATLLIHGTTVPSGFLKKNGASVLRADFPALWAFAQASGALAPTQAGKTAAQFGPGNGSTTFTLPDDRGQFHRVWDDGKGTDAGRTLGSVQADGVGTHTHPATASTTGAHTHTGGLASGGFANFQTGGPTFPDEVSGNTGSAGNHTHTITVSADPAATPETRVKNVSLMAVIKF